MNKDMDFKFKDVARSIPFLYQFQTSYFFNSEKKEENYFFKVLNEM